VLSRARKVEARSHHPGMGPGAPSVNTHMAGVVVSIEARITRRREEEEAEEEQDLEDGRPGSRQGANTHYGSALKFASPPTK